MTTNHDGLPSGPTIGQIAPTMLTRVGCMEILRDGTARLRSCRESRSLRARSLGPRFRLPGSTFHGHFSSRAALRGSGVEVFGPTETPRRPVMEEVLRRCIVIRTTRHLGHAQHAQRIAAHGTWVQIPPVPPAESPGIIGIPGLSPSRDVRSPTNPPHLVYGGRQAGGREVDLAAPEPDRADDDRFRHDPHDPIRCGWRYSAGSKREVQTWR